MTDKELQARYLETSLSFRKLGAEIGRSEFYIRSRLRALPGHYEAVTRTILNRITIARSKRQLKHAYAMVRRHRPALYTELLERTRPATCQDCASAIQAQIRGMWWRWSCASCGSTGRAPCLS